MHKSPEVGQLVVVRLQFELDKAVAAAYAWQDLELGYGSHETMQGIRYTISETARREVLDRLLALTIGGTPKKKPNEHLSLPQSPPSLAEVRPPAAPT